MLFRLPVENVEEFELSTVTAVVHDLFQEFKQKAGKVGVKIGDRPLVVLTGANQVDMFSHHLWRGKGQNGYCHNTLNDRMCF